jgi:hypothetical protein
VVNPGLMLLQELIMALTMSQAGCMVTIAFPTLETLGLAPGLSVTDEVDLNVETAL